MEMIVVIYRRAIMMYVAQSVFQNKHGVDNNLCNLYIPVLRYIPEITSKIKVPDMIHNITPQNFSKPTLILVPKV